MKPIRSANSSLSVATNPAITSLCPPIYLEAECNTIRITDIQASADIARKHNLISVVDNTFMSPYFQNPLALGADIVYTISAPKANGFWK